MADVTADMDAEHAALLGRRYLINAAIAVGSTVALLGLFASPISGASMNPARTLGPEHRRQ